MKNFNSLSIALLVALFTCHSQAQNYELKSVSSLIDGCDFIHKDEYSFKPVLNLIQEQLRTKLEGDKECTAPLAQLSGQMLELDQFYNQNLTAKEKARITQDAQKQYLTDLQGEMTVLDPSDANDAIRIATLQGIMDSVKGGLVTLGVDAELSSYEDAANKQTKINAYWEGVYNRSAAALTAMNAVPDKCIDKVGGWKMMAPAVLNLASMAGPLIGGAAGSIVSAGFQVASQLSILLQNNKVKRGITSTVRVQNHQIIACSYLALQTNACELRRAKKLMDHKKIYELINQEFKDPKYTEYEKYFRVIQILPKIQEIFNDVGAMGSALTLDLDLLYRYFSAVKLQPDKIEYPENEEDIAALNDFILKMRSRSLSTSQFDSDGKPIPIPEQYQALKQLIQNAKDLIGTVRALLTSKRSFVDLKETIVTKNQFAANELRFFRKFIQYHLNGGNLPSQYRSIFKINEGMLDVLVDFVGADMLENETVDQYRVRIDILGQQLFDEMSKGSVAQITTQSVLMIPAIAFERFNRPIKALEHVYLANDIINKDDPTYVPYTDYVINRSLQLKLIALYEPLNGSSEAFRVETYLAALNGIKKGFKKDIIKMVKGSMENDVDILEDFKGVTPAQLCALYAPFLKEESPKLFQKCQADYKELSLYPVLGHINRPTKMTIDYSDSCFYNNYKREERGQRRLFEKLIDYGTRNNLIWD